MDRDDAGRDETYSAILTVKRRLHQDVLGEGRNFRQELSSQPNWFVHLS